MSDQIVGRLKEIALKVAENEGARIADLSSEIDNLEARLAEFKGALDLARTAVIRGDNFSPELDGYYQCPICWVSQGNHADLTALQSDTAEDLLQCENCNRQIEIEHPC